MSFGNYYTDFYKKLKLPDSLPEGVEILNPFESDQVVSYMDAFYSKYYSDDNPRLFLIGINPGRFGAGVTGIPFTDPIRLESVCGIKNDLGKKQELSSVFMYDMINAYGGPDAFYGKCFFTSVSPVGFVMNGKNLNYYDIPELQKELESFMVDSLRKQLDMGGLKKIAYSLGMGKNIKYLHYLNKKYHLFEEIKALPHPRWVMQYRLKRKDEFIEEYLKAIDGVD